MSSNKSNPTDITDTCWPCDEKLVDPLPACPLQCRSEKCKAYQKLSFEEKPIIWVIGGPGSGRSTQAQKIATKYGYFLLSIDDLVQQEAKTPTVRGKCLSKALERGELAPDDLVLDLLKNDILSNLERYKGFVIDGYPRAKKQGIGFEKKIAPCTIIIYLEASTDTMTKRLEVLNPPHVVRRKLKLFNEKKDSLIVEFLDKIQSFNADRNVEDIFQDICAVLDPIVTKKLPPPKL